MKHRIQIAVSFGGRAGSATLIMEGEPDMLDDADPADVAEVLAESLAAVVQRALDGELEADLLLDEDDDDDDEGGEWSIN